MKATEAAVESALRRLSALPAPVDSWLVETGHDWTDDPAVRVWAILENDDVDIDKRDRLREIVRKTVGEIDDESLVYVRFRAASEEV